MATLAPHRRPPTATPVPCAYNQFGEVDANLQCLLDTESWVTTPFALHADSARFHLPAWPALSDNPTCGDSSGRSPQ